MITHTKSFATLKEEAQLTFNFAIMVAHAVPWLKYSIKNLAPDGLMPIRADYFDSRPVAIAQVKESTLVYKKSLARHIFFSSFSFFEAYVSNVLKEIIAFHDKEKLLSRTDLNTSTTSTSPEDTKIKRKLQEYYTVANKDRYIYNGRKLNAKGYRFPSTLLSTYGLRQLCKLIEDDKMRAVEIPDMLQEALHLTLDKSTEVDVFQSHRETRNRIAHGTASSVDFNIPNAVKANDFLRNLALKIDRHVVQYFFVVETF